MNGLDPSRSVTLSTIYTMSEALVWHLIRDNNSFLVKRGRTNRDGAVQFSKEPGNVLNVNAFKYSGIANEKALDVTTVLVDKTKKPDGKKAPAVALNKKTGKSLNKPKAAVEKVVLKKKADALKALADLSASGFRSDLAAAAKIRYLKLFKDAQIRRGAGKKARKQTARDSRR